MRFSVGGYQSSTQPPTLEDQTKDPSADISKFPRGPPDYCTHRAIQ